MWICLPHLLRSNTWLIVCRPVLFCPSSQRTELKLENLEEDRSGSSSATHNVGTSGCQPHRDHVAADRSSESLQVYRLSRMRLNWENSASQCRRIKTQHAVKASAGRLKGKKDERKKKKEIGHSWVVESITWSGSNRAAFQPHRPQRPSKQSRAQSEGESLETNGGKLTTFPLLHQFLCLQMLKNKISFFQGALIFLSVKDQLQTHVCACLWHKVDDNMVGCHCSVLFGFDVSWLLHVFVWFFLFFLCLCDLCVWIDRKSAVHYLN